MALTTIGIVLITLVAAITLTTWQGVRAIVAEKETRATLEKLKDEAYERALNEALLSGANADDLIQRAETLEVSQPKLFVLRGLQAFYRGDLQDAIRLLEQGEKSVAARAVLAWAYSVAGDHDRFATTAIALNKPTPMIAPDYFLLGQLHSAVLPDVALSYIETGLALTTNRYSVTRSRPWHSQLRV